MEDTQKKSSNEEDIHKYFSKLEDNLKPDWRTRRTKYLIGGRPPHWRTLVSYDGFKLSMELYIFK